MCKTITQYCLFKWKQKVIERVHEIIGIDSWNETKKTWDL